MKIQGQMYSYDSWEMVESAQKTAHKVWALASYAYLPKNFYLTYISDIKSKS